jgi:hypothetical protein
VTSNRSLAVALVAVATQFPACGPSPEPGVPPGPIAPRPGTTAEPGAARVGVPPTGPLTSDEGMWTFDNFPSKRLEQRHGFAPDQAWLDKVRLSSARLARGCSGSFVSASGLVMTNHHCAHPCIEDLSTKAKDYVKSGFYAASEKDEVKCPEMEVNQLVEIKDVTARVTGATQGKSGSDYIAAQRAEMSRIEKESCSGEESRCDVVSLYQGGLYHLYKYRRFQDVRLVFAPELGIAFFGGDPDNFNFPRYDLDLSFVRVYENGKPAQVQNYFQWSPAGAKAGELTFVTGHPGKTSRNSTVAELAYERDVALPLALTRVSETRGWLTEFQHRGPEQKRVSGALLFGMENALKAFKGRRQALVSPALWNAKVEAERDLRARIEADPPKKAKYAGAWDAIAGAVEALKGIQVAYALVEGGTLGRARGAANNAFWGSMRLEYAMWLVRSADEIIKPNDQRLREYADAKLPELKQKLFSTAPVYDEFETRVLASYFVRLREELGADHPVVKKILGKDSPEDVATALIKGTKLGKLEARKALFDGGKAAVDASKDPMIEMARRLDPEARAVRKQFEDEVESVLQRNGELVGKAKFDVYGTSVYPDATFTLRLSFGKVAGWNEGKKTIDPFTKIGGAYERHTGKDPFALPQRWLDAKDKLNLETPMNFVTTNDIIGGNSGSPVINKDRQVVGLIFDGNIHSLGGEYAFDETVNRAVSVHSAAITEALDKVYNAQRLLADLRGQPAPAAAAPAAKPEVKPATAKPAPAAAKPAPKK